jgi:xanthine dehydrogenase accessory factor
MQEIYEKIKTLLQEGKEFVLATVVNAESSTSGKMGFKMIVLPDGTTYGTVGGGVFEKDVIEHAKELFKTHGTLFKTYILREGEESSLGMVCGGTIQIYMEYIGNKPQLIIFGAGHIGKKLHDILSLDDTFDLIVCDNRKDFATTERFPNAIVYNSEDFSTSIKEMDIKNGAFVVIVTAGGKDDPIILKELYEKGVQYNYIGMIGSLNRKNKCFTEARKLGVKDAFLNKIFAPIGLAINGETPFEIAIAIIGEVIAVRKGALKNIKTEKEAHNESI